MTNLTLEELKEKANSLGITFNAKIGADKLAEKIDRFENPEKAEAIKEANTSKGKKLTPIQMKIMKATDLSNVTITNLDPDNSGASTVYACVENEYFNVSKVVPLDVPLALEACLIKKIKKMQSIGYVPVVKDGKNTGTFTHKAIPTYAVTYNK